METDDYPSLPRLAQLHARLAANSRRVEAVVDVQLDGIERLLSATTAEDWEAVAQATRYLANLTPDKVHVDVIREARQLCEELGRTPRIVKRPKHLTSLLAACRVAKQKRHV